MNQILIGLIVAMGLGGWFLYNQNITLKNENTALTFAVEEQKKTIAAVKESYETQGKALNQLTSRNALIEAEMNGYLDIFRRHNLNKLAIAKPGMIETRANEATKAVFESIENDSKELDSLDNPSADINPNN
jgi:hypothetical protein|tara:strand:+ start:29 stop:424 length:396 start_codon:yes stop_codon:yes gene_type:complete